MLSMSSTDREDLRHGNLGLDVESCKDPPDIQRAKPGGGCGMQSSSAAACAEADTAGVFGWLLEVCVSVVGMKM